MHSARPTLRCLDEDLGLPLPSIAVPLDDIDRPLLGKAAAQFSDTETERERIRSIDDAVLFKVKVQRWRGAIWVDADLPWLVAAGQRRRRLQRRLLRGAGGRGQGCAGPLQRCAFGRSQDLDVQQSPAAHSCRPRPLPRRSRRPLRPTPARNDETYAAVRITGSVPANLATVILGNIPGCDIDGWYPECALPERDLLPAEQAWSNLMDPRAAAAILNAEA